MLACEIELATGERIRYGPDEADVGSVPTQISFGSEMPGGFGPADITLPRPDRFDLTEARLWAATRIYEAETNRTFHKGRITGTPQVGALEIQLEIEGFAKALEDDKTARFLGYDIDKANWESAATAEKLRQAVASFSPQDSNIVPDDTTGQPALELMFEGDWVTPPLAMAVYDAGGNRIGSVDYAWKKNANVAAGGTSFEWTLAASADDTFELGALDATGDLEAAGPGSGTLTTTLGDKRFAAVWFTYTAAGGAAGMQYATYWTLLGVVGTHGIPLQGTVAAPNTGRGLLVSDVLAHLVGRFAPSLTYSTGVGGSIEPTSFAVPHMVFREDTTALEMIEAMVLLGGNTNQPIDWGVYEEFFAKAPGSYGNTWRLRLDEGAEETSAGPDASRRLNGVKVVYDDGTGSDHSVGPPGSGSDVETTALLDTDPDNPANTRGERHWESFSAGITSAAGALLIGQLILAERNRQDWRGEVTAKRQVRDAAGNLHPVAAMRAGDTAINEDSNDPTERRIVDTSYNQDGDSNTVSIGQDPDRLDVLLARIGVVTVGRIA